MQDLHYSRTRIDPVCCRTLTKFQDQEHKPSMKLPINNRCNSIIELISIKVKRKTIAWKRMNNIFKFITLKFKFNFQQTNIEYIYCLQMQFSDSSKCFFCFLWVVRAQEVHSFIAKGKLVHGQIHYVHTRNIEINSKIQKHPNPMPFGLSGCLSQQGKLLSDD